MAKETRRRDNALTAFYKEWFGPQPKMSKEEKRRLPPFKRLWHEWLWPLIWAVLVVKFLINPFLLAAYHVPTGSMENTILPGEWLMADKFSYGIHIPFSDAYVLPLSEPRPGQIMVFKSPYDGRTLVKRCVAGAGDTVAVRGKKLFINGVERTEAYVRHNDPHELEIDYRLIDPDQFQRAWQEGQMSHSPFRDNFGPVVVPAGHLFMMGDNRDDSFDSRFWGPLPRRYVQGRPLIIYWSWDSWSSLQIHEFWKRPRLGRLGRLLFKS
ncbi:MAG TPA: signal peptidase I [candidate division Zixibacteria bacterium]|jgi:signal peptidase I|nr:signal peptidase I [candidate division Zixibacteria bacterium]